MALPPLASPEQLGARLGRTFAEGVESDQAVALLADASAQIRRYTGQQLTEVANDLQVLIGPDDDELVLPQRPVTAVTLVRVLAESPGLVFPVTDWRLVRDRLVRGFSWSAWTTFDAPAGMWPSQSHLIEVTYTHGYATIPDDIVAVCCSRAARSLADPGGFLQGETIGNYAYRLDRNADLGLGAGFTEAELEILDDYGRTYSSGTINVRSG